MQLREKEKEKKEKKIPNFSLLNRISFNRLIPLQDIQEFDTENNTKESIVNSPQNFLNEENAEATDVSPAYHTNNFKPETGFDFRFKGLDENKTMNFNNFTDSSNSFLTQRRTISFNVNNNPNGKIYQSQKNKLRRNNLTHSFNNFKKKFMAPVEDKKYPKAFLPEPGFGLLTNPFPMINEKRQNKAKI